MSNMAGLVSGKIMATVVAVVVTFGIFNVIDPLMNSDSSGMFYLGLLLLGTTIAGWVSFIYYYILGE